MTIKLDGRVGRFMTAENWCKKWSAEKRNGFPVYSTDPQACRFCLQGYVKKLYKNKPWSVIDHIVKTFFKDDITNMHQFNDNSTFDVVHRKVLEMNL